MCVFFPCVYTVLCTRTVDVCACTYTNFVHAYVTNEQLIAQFMCLCVVHYCAEERWRQSHAHSTNEWMSRWNCEWMISQHKYNFVNTEPRFILNVVLCSRRKWDEYTERTRETQHKKNMWTAQIHRYTKTYALPARPQKTKRHFISHFQYIILWYIVRLSSSIVSKFENFFAI